ncbi:MAG: amidohydrolase family protein [Gemmatimonadota bacterium]|nr:amidohydrolase family protein [Gemmatimonadota bacterium]
MFLKIIDSHTHFFPDKVARTAIPRMEETSGCKAYTDGTAAGLLDSMDAVGIESSVVLPVVTNPEKVSSVNRFSASAARSMRRLCIMGALHPAAAAWPGHLEELLDLGFTGVKLHPDYQEFSPDDPRLLPFFSGLRDAGLLVFFHAGEDLSYEPPCKGTPASLATLLGNLPGLRIVAAHMGGYRSWDEVDRCLVGRENVYMDTSFSFREMSDSRIRSMIERHGTDNVLFGTDSPWLDQSQEVENVLRLGLGSDVEEKVLYSNALRLIPRLAG